MLTKLAITPTDALALVLVVLSAVAFAPPLMFDAWTPRFVLLMGAAPYGWLLLIARVRDGDRSALLASAALGWAFVAAFTTGDLKSALVGTVGRDLSFLTVAGAFGYWEIGRSLTARGRGLMAPSVVFATSFAALIGALQVALDVRAGPLALASSRPTGLQTNPVYFGAVCACGLAAAIAWNPVRGRFAWALAALVLGVGCTLSGSRVALLGALLVIVGAPLLMRRRGVVLAALWGLVALTLGVALDRLLGSGRNAVNRISEDSGSEGRADIWRYGLDAVADRPVFGWGLGRFRSAVQGRFSAAFVRDNVPSETASAWFDPHNVVIGVAVSVGIVGLALFAIWALSAARTARGPLAWAVVPMLCSWLLQPVAIITLPLVMLLLGASMQRDVHVVANAARDVDPDGSPLEPVVEPSEPRLSPGFAPARRAVVVAALLGVIGGVYVLGADLLLRSAANDVDGPRAEVAARLFLDDPVVNDLVAQVHSLGRSEESGDLELEWRIRTVEAEPDRPHWWTALARVQIERGDLSGASTSVQRALEIQRYNSRALATEAVIAARLGDLERLQIALDTLCEVGEGCDLSAEDVLADFRERASETSDEGAGDA